MLSYVGVPPFLKCPPLPSNPIRLILEMHAVSWGRMTIFKDLPITVLNLVAQEPYSNKGTLFYVGYFMREP